MSVARHTAYNFIGAVVPIAVSLVTVPLYLQVIGLDRYGVLAICWLLVGYFGLFELGLGPASAQRIAEMKDRRPQARSDLLWNALWMALAVGSLGGVVLFVVGDYALTAMRGVGPGMSGEIDRSLPWLALMVPASTAYGVLNGALQGRRQFLRMNVVSGTSNVLLAAVPLAVAFFHDPRLPYLLAAMLVTRIGSVAALVLYCRNAVPLRRPTAPSVEILQSLARFGGWVTGSGILTPLLTSIEKLLIGWRIGAAAVSVYVIPFNLLARLLVLPQSLSSALFPKFAGTDRAEADRLEYEGVRSLAAALTPPTVLAMALLAPFLQLWIGPDLARQAAPLGHLLLVGLWFNGLSHIPHARLQGSGRPDLVTKISLSQVVPYLLILYWVIGAFGVVGAAVVWSARAGVETGIFFAVTRQPGRLLPIIALPAAIVVASYAAALRFDPGGPSYWLVMALLLCASVGAAIAAMPIRNWSGLWRQNLEGRG
jgi:O-antigen/teichoic acid export membrane protein